MSSLCCSFFFSYRRSAGNQKAVTRDKKGYGACPLLAILAFQLLAQNDFQ
jgi:hypothetical protein